MRFSIDTNVFLYVKNKEEPYYEYSKKILQLIDDGELEGVVPAIVAAELCAGYHEFDELAEKDELLTQLRRTRTTGSLTLIWRLQTRLVGSGP